MPESRSEKNNKELPELILVDKPKGLSSFDVIRILRKQLNVKKMGHALKPPKLGHAGTLDPLATGLLLIGVGKGTKKLHDLVGLPKIYEVEILLGRKTTTGDMEGEVIEQKEIKGVKLLLGLKKEDILRSATKKLIGVLRLPVPVYCAVKQGGVPLYKKARSGKEVVVPIRQMQIFDARFLWIKNNEKNCVVALELDVASGVYVRSVAEEFGRILGLPATVKELRRTKIGEFDVKNAQTLELGEFKVRTKI